MQEDCANEVRKVLAYHKPLLYRLVTSKNTFINTNEQKLSHITISSTLRVCFHNISPYTTHHALLTLHSNANVIKGTCIKGLFTSTRYQQTRRLGERASEPSISLSNVVLSFQRTNRPKLRPRPLSLFPYFLSWPGKKRSEANVKYLLPREAASLAVVMSGRVTQGTAKKTRCSFLASRGRSLAFF